MTANRSPTMRDAPREERDDVDRSLVEDVERDPEAASVVGAVVALAHARGLQAVGEGVEVVGQLDRLRALGCDVAQGFFFARPDPADKVGERLGLPV